MLVKLFKKLISITFKIKLVLLLWTIIHLKVTSMFANAKLFRLSSFAHQKLSSCFDKIFNLHKSYMGFFLPFLLETDLLFQ